MNIIYVDLFCYQDLILFLMSLWIWIYLGVKFLYLNINRMEDDDVVYMLIGFEIVFLVMFDDVKVLGLDLLYDVLILQQILVEREKKMKK